MKNMLILILILIAFSSLTISYAGENDLTLKIKGMTCPSCAASVESHLNKIKGINSVDISLSKQQAIVALQTDATPREQTFREAIKKAGFKLVSISKK